MTIQCPGCGTALEPAATSCPTCMRPRSRQEIFAGYGRARDEEAQRKVKPLKYLRNLLALGLVAGGGIHLVQKEWKAPGHLSEAVQQLAQTAGRYRRGTSAISPDPAPAPPEPPAATPKPPPPEPPVAAKEPSPSPAVSPETPKQKSLEPANSAAQWTIYGKVFWFVDLKPAAGATLIFKDKIGKTSVRGLIAPDGGYKIELPPLEEGGYEVAVYVKSKSRLFIEDTVGPSVRRYNLERRKDEAAEHLRQGGVLHVPLLLPKDVMTLQYDLALLP